MLNKSKDELMADARATETALLDLWAVLKDQMTPDDLAQALSERAEAARSTVKAHPLATAAVGAGVSAGLIWFFGTKKTETPTANYATRAAELRDAAQAELAELTAAAKARIARVQHHDDSVLAQGQSLARQHPIGAVMLGLAAGAGLAMLFPRGRAAASAALETATPKAMGATIMPAMTTLASKIVARASQVFEPPIAEPKTKKTLAPQAKAAPVAKPSVKRVRKAKAAVEDSADAKPVADAPRTNGAARA